MDIKINKDLVKEAVCEKLARLQSMPMVLQTLEDKGNNDKLHNLLGLVVGCEFEEIEDKVQENIDAKENPEAYCDAVEENSRIFKDNLKKALKIIGRTVLFNK